ncbi:hypothetical protein QOT17_008586 [Balamuthia mandrillaris]
MKKKLKRKAGEENGRSNNLRTVEEEEGDEEDNEREGRSKKGANTKNTPPTYPILKEPLTLPPHLLNVESAAEAVGAGDYRCLCAGLHVCQEFGHFGGRLDAGLNSME